jgi:sigma-B regulation protein RsbU (phosphoserine phosphatase)
MTCFVGLVDTETGVMTFANGGHCMPVIVSPLGVEVRDYQNAGKAKTVKNRMFSISSRGDPLGFSDTVSYEESVIQLMAGDKILLYTDGFLENFNAEKVPLGKGKFKKLVLSTVDRKGPEMVSELVHSYIDYIGSAAPIDDVTVVVAEVKDDWVEKRKSGAA